MKFSFQNVLINEKRVVISKWVDSCNHLINENSQSPPIYRFSMSLILKNLRCKIFRSSAKSKSSIINLLSKAKISQFEISISPNQNVLGLEISVNDIFRVKILKDENHVWCVETDLIDYYAALWASNIPSSLRWVKSYPPETNSINM